MFGCHNDIYAAGDMPAKIHKSNPDIELRNECNFVREHATPPPSALPHRGVALSAGSRSRAARWDSRGKYL